MIKEPATEVRLSKKFLKAKKRCRHKYEPLQQTIFKGRIVEAIDRCVKCETVRTMFNPAKEP